MNLPDPLINALADALWWWHDNPDPSKFFNLHGVERQGEGKQGYGHYLRKLRNLDEIGKALAPFMDANPDEKVLQLDWVNLRAKVITELANAGYRYRSRGKIAPVKRVRRLQFARHELDFMKNIPLRAVIERDCEEIKRAFKAECWKSAIILSGAAIEATLADALRSTLSSSKLAKSSLWDLIKEAKDKKFIGADAAEMSQLVRNYRNLVHASAETRTELHCSEETAAIALEVLKMVCKDLSEAG